MPDTYKLQYDGMTLTYPGWDGCVSYEELAQIYNLQLIQRTGGTTYAEPTSGYKDTIVNLSSVPSAGYSFNTYNITGSTLTGNTFSFNDTDVTVEPSWTHNVYNLTLQNDGHGSIAAGKTTGYYQDTTNLSTTANNYYQFKNYSITGGSVNGNTFTWNDGNATAKANFELKPSALLYSSGFNFTAKAGTTQTMQMNYNLPTGTYNYFACKFGVCWPNGCSMEDDYNCVSNNFDWSIIICSPVPSTAVPIYWGNKTNWTQTGCATAANGNSRRIWYTGANCKSIRPYKAVYDNVNGRVLLYYNNQARMTFTGVGKCTQIQKLYHHCWNNFSVTARCSGCYIAGFKDLTAAQAW